MRYEQHRGAIGYQFFNTLEAALLEQGVAYGERLVDDQDFGFYLHLHGKSQPNQHTAGVGFYRLIQVLADIGERSDCIEFFVYLRSRKTKQRTIEIDILSTGEIGVKS